MEFTVRFLSIFTSFCTGMLIYILFKNKGGDN